MNSIPHNNTTPENMESKADTDDVHANPMAKPVVPGSITCDTNTNTTTADNSFKNSDSQRHSQKTVVVTFDPHILEMMSNDDGDDDSDNRNKRKTYLCCGFMCDVLRACVILDGLFIFLSILHILSSVFQIPFMAAYDLNQSAASFDDDFVELGGNNNNNNNNNMFAINNIEDIDTRGKFALLRMVLSIVFGGIGIYGAVTFRKSLVLATAVWYVIYLVTNAVEQKVIAMFWGFSVYPHIALFLAFQNRTITRENYDNTEKHCCCDGCLV